MMKPLRRQRAGLWALGAWLALGVVAGGDGARAAQPVAELHREVAAPEAALRDAQGRAELRATLWRPAANDAVEQEIIIGPPDAPLLRVGTAALDAPPPKGAGPWPTILLSHGYGGSARSLGWLGIGLARAGFLVIAVDHPGNNARDPKTAAGDRLWWLRATDLQAALAALRRDPAIGPQIDATRLGVAGFSAGGFTALVTAGARVDLAQFARFCAAHPGDVVCLPQPEASGRVVADPAAFEAALAKAGDDYALPGLRGVFALAPGLVQALTLDSLAGVKTPTLVMWGEADKIAPPVSNAEVVAATLPGAQTQRLPGVGHYEFLPECTPKGAQVIPQCAGVTGQKAAHDAVIARAAAFFAHTLTAAPAIK